MLRKPRGDALAGAQRRRVSGRTAATRQRAHIRVIFERHESLPMASGSVALSGAMGGVDPELKVGSIVLMGGAIEQALRAGVQPTPEAPYMQLHVKPPIVIESTSPTANTARLAGPPEKRTRRGGRVPLLYEGAAVARAVGLAVTAQEEQIGV